MIAMFGVGAETDRDRVKTILRRQRVMGRGAAQAGADDAPIRCAFGQQIVDENRLMRAMEGADTEMHDARRDFGAVIGRSANGGRKPIEAGVRETQIPPCRCLTLGLALTHGIFAVNRWWGGCPRSRQLGLLLPELTLWLPKYMGLVK